MTQWEARSSAKPLNERNNRPKMLLWEACPSTKPLNERNNRPKMLPGEAFSMKTPWMSGIFVVKCCEWDQYSSSFIKDYSLDLSILIREGKESNCDFLSTSEGKEKSLSWISNERVVGFSDPWKIGQRLKLVTIAVTLLAQTIEG